ncbi:uncharacterized protein LOC127629523 [Xyrauchen texanus]|uniref:uncharacterized protein LOC127629523 n=1 Tax=Xyrauchen texanus TaxID=154827 RepID=UPI00224205BC|nr:uncharacterized protein LOC127629523 [Xyrauchen texanus]
MAKRIGPYKRYLRGTDAVPRRTKFRWNAKRSQEDGTSSANNEDDDSLLNVNNNKDDRENTEDDMSNASNSEDEDEEDEVDNENVSTTKLLGTDIQENDSEDDRINTEDDMSIASNSEDVDNEVDNDKSSTISLMGTDTEENEDSIGSDSNANVLDAARSGDENDVDSEDLMEGNTSGENPSEFSVGSEDTADTGDKPLYPGAPLSKGESVLMLMSYLLRHNLTGEALTHLLEMFNIMFPGLIPSSHYIFHKEFGSSSKFEVHFYCESCLKYFGISTDCPTQCDSCNTVFDANANLKNGFYFLVLSLYAQIKQLLQEHGVSLNEKTRTFGVLSDIQSGEEYLNLCDSGILAKDDLTLIWNCDGAPVFKSSKCSIWPIQCQVIELGPEVRKKHILMSALWFGPSKPSISDSMAQSIASVTQSSLMAFTVVTFAITKVYPLPGEVDHCWMLTRVSKYPFDMPANLSPAMGFLLMELLQKNPNEPILELKIILTEQNSR